MTSLEYKLSDNNDSFDTAAIDAPVFFEELPTVTIICIAYNHGEFLREAFDGFVMQKTNFPFKALIGDDCSTDNSAEIIQEYAQRYPDIIIPVLREQNMGGTKNLRDLCNRINSTYVAFCEGDDYWIDPDKLQKQYDYMQAHPEATACFCDAEIKADEDWVLNSYYQPDQEGRRCIPSGIPGYGNTEKHFTAGSYISSGSAHTSTMFFRWDHSHKLPKILDDLAFGDHFVMMLQIRDGLATYLPDVVSVYRRHENGSVFYSTLSEHMFEVQKGWLFVLEALRDYFGHYYYSSATITGIENRAKLVFRNFFNACLSTNNVSEIVWAIERFPLLSTISLRAYLSFYNDSRTLTASLSWGRYQRLVRRPEYRAAFCEAGISIDKKLDKKQQSVEKKHKIKIWLLYWLGAFYKKDPNLWVITSFYQKGFLDNTKYFYQYVTENHPEINIVWLTSDAAVLEQLTKENKPCAIMGSPTGRRLLMHASLAITDHFIRSDYPNSAFNVATKVVQLWHGIGPKRNILNEISRVPGVQNSDDILPEKGDGSDKLVLKFFKRLRHEPFREFPEKRYFLHLVSGHTDKEHEEKSWHLKKDRFFVCGSPRTAMLHQVAKGIITPQMEEELAKSKTVKYRVIYAPTYRWNEENDHHLNRILCENFRKINACMAILGGEFTYRPHPHIWRDYGRDTMHAMRGLSHIRIDHEKDVYPTLGIFDVMITDYSSIASDFLILNRPIIYLWPDIEEWVNIENSVKYDLAEFSCGDQVNTWGDALKSLSVYLQNPSKDSEWRARIRDIYFDKEVNDENNSERIVAELKRRLKICP